MSCLDYVNKLHFVLFVGIRFFMNLYYYDYFYNSSLLTLERDYLFFDLNNDNFNVITIVMHLYMLLII